MQVAKPQLEMNFIEFVALPLWNTVAQAFSTFETRVSTMLENHEQWASLLRKRPSFTGMSIPQLTLNRRSSKSISCGTGSPAKDVGERTGSPESASPTRPEASASNSRAQQERLCVPHARDKHSSYCSRSSAQQMRP